MRYARLISFLPRAQKSKLTAAAGPGLEIMINIHSILQCSCCQVRPRPAQSPDLIWAMSYQAMSTVLSKLETFSIL